MKHNHKSTESEVSKELEALVYQATLGGPGLDGYAYNADTYCIDCGLAITRDILYSGESGIKSTSDTAFRDSEVIPCPIFFGESDRAVYCSHCGEYMYGSNNE